MLAFIKTRLARRSAAASLASVRTSSTPERPLLLRQRAMPVKAQSAVTLEQLDALLIAADNGICAIMTEADHGARDDLKCEVATVIAMARAEVRYLKDELGLAASDTQCPAGRPH